MDGGQIRMSYGGGSQIGVDFIHAGISVKLQQ